MRDLVERLGVSPIQMKALAIIDEAGGTSPSWLARKLWPEPSGRNGRKKRTAQGLGLKGGAVLAELRKMGLVRGEGRFHRHYVLTAAGQAALKSRAGGGHEGE